MVGQSHIVPLVSTTSMILRHVMVAGMAKGSKIIQRFQFTLHNPFIPREPVMYLQSFRTAAVTTAIVVKDQTLKTTSLKCSSTAVSHVDSEKTFEVHRNPMPLPSHPIQAGPVRSLPSRTLLIQAQPHHALYDYSGAWSSSLRYWSSAQRISALNERRCSFARARMASMMRSGMMMVTFFFGPLSNIPALYRINTSKSIEKSVVYAC